jgi:hypothetical protein
LVPGVRTQKIPLRGLRDVALLAVSALVVASHALASEPPPRERTKALLAELDQKGASRGAARDAVAEARRALGRADKARLAGDQKHGAELEALALEWAEAGRDLARTQAAEERATELEKKLTDAEVKLRTTRTLIEQAAARRARADAELAELRRNADAPAPSATSPKTAPSATSPKTAPSAAPPKTAPSATPPAVAPPKTAPSAAPPASAPAKTAPAPAKPKEVK